MSPEVQKALNDALLVLIPVIATWAVGKIRSVVKDTNAAFEKIRAHEDVMGIQTKVEGGKVLVTSRPDPTKIVGSIDPQSLRPGGG